MISTTPTNTHRYQYHEIHNDSKSRNQTEGAMLVTKTGASTNVISHHQKQEQRAPEDGKLMSKPESAIERLGLVQTRERYSNTSQVSFVPSPPPNIRLFNRYYDFQSDDDQSREVSGEQKSCRVMQEVSPVHRVNPNTTSTIPVTNMCGIDSWTGWQISRTGTEMWRRHFRPQIIETGQNDLLTANRPSTADMMLSSRRQEERLSFQSSTHLPSGRPIIHPPNVAINCSQVWPMRISRADHCRPLGIESRNCSMPYTSIHRFSTRGNSNIPNANVVTKAGSMGQQIQEMPRKRSLVEHVQRPPYKRMYTVHPGGENTVVSNLATEKFEKTSHNQGRPSIITAGWVGRPPTEKERIKSPVSLEIRHEPLIHRSSKNASGFDKLDLLCSATLEMGEMYDNPSGCACPKSKCIALYCDCFKAGRRCNSDKCKCLDCKNTVEESGADGARTRAIRCILARNPRAFTTAGMGNPNLKLPPGQIACNCVRSRCLKLYCSCFQHGEACNPRVCTCVGCYNIESDDNGRRNGAIQLYLEKRPDAFTGKKPREVGIGCACKNNRCVRKYCECFRTNITCTEKCLCRQCENGKVVEKEHQQSSAEQRDSPSTSEVKDEGHDDTSISELQSQEANTTLIHSV